MSTPISKAAEEYWKRLEATGMAYEFTAETICLRAFQDGRDSVSHSPALQWTAERPTKPGWYFFRYKNDEMPGRPWIQEVNDFGLVEGAYEIYMTAGPMALPLPSEPQAKET